MLTAVAAALAVAGFVDLTSATPIVLAIVALGLLTAVVLRRRE
jgi:hypothetical protein